LTGEALEQAEYGIDRSDVRVLPTPLPQDDDAVAPLRRLLREEGETIAALIFEPILGSAGVVELSDVFLREAPALCREHDVLLIVDEVATGFGRTGRMFASERFGLEPDLMTLSKGINSGYLPLGATAVAERVHEAFASRGAVFAHGETQAGNPLACAAALATLDVIESDDLVARAERIGGVLRAGLDGLLEHPHVGEIRGRGLMLGIGLVAAPGVAVAFDTVLATLRHCARAGLLVHPAPHGVSLFPPLVLDEAGVERIVATLHEVLGRLRLA
jgi:adenosylmethionine-8-amino-7-oxononanoate aminotransferase